MPKAILALGATLPPGLKLENLRPDPGKRSNHVLDTDSGSVFNLGFKVTFEDSAEPAAPAAKDITGTKVKFQDGRRGVITEPGDLNAEDEADRFYARVLVDGKEITVATKAELKPLSKTEIAAWDKEIEDAS